MHCKETHLMFRFLIKSFILFLLTNAAQKVILRGSIFCIKVLYNMTILTAKILHYFQVALPGIHISLAVLNDFFKMVKEESTVLDIKIAEMLAERKRVLEMNNFKRIKYK